MTSKFVSLTNFEVCRTRVIRHNDNVISELIRNSENRITGRNDINQYSQANVHGGSAARRSLNARPFYTSRYSICSVERKHAIHDYRTPEKLLSFSRDGNISRWLLFSDRAILISRLLQMEKTIATNKMV